MKWAQQSDLAEVVCVLSNKKEAGVLGRAQKLGVPAFSLLKKKSEPYDQRLLTKLSEYQPDWIILAGYMRLLSEAFLEHYDRRVINIHPSLLPDFPGLDGYGDTYKSTSEVAGCTVHYVDAGMDTGEIIAQRKFNKISGESFSDFKARGLAIENIFYVEVLEKLLKGQI